MNNACRNGSQTTPNFYADRQYHSPWSRKQQHTVMMHKSHGHKISRAALPQSSTPIPFLLAPRPHQQGRLLDQASLRSPSHQKEHQNFNPQDCTGRPTCISKNTPALQLLALPSSKPSQFTQAAAAAYILPQHYIEVLKGCVRYPLSNYKGIWNSHVGSLPLHIFLYMAQYSENGGKL